jgi:hypothetical protein
MRHNFNFPSLSSENIIVGAVDVVLVPELRVQRSTFGAQP